MNSDEGKLDGLLRSCVQEGTFRKAVFSKPVVKSADLAGRVDVRPVMIKGRPTFQFTERIGTQEHHRNLSSAEAIEEMTQLAGTTFRDVRLETATDEWIARHNRRGRCTLQHSVLTSSVAEAATEHNRSRQYLIPDGTPCPFLIATDIMSKAGRVHAKHSRKFRQINRYAEFINDIVDQLPPEGLIRVVDFGCGKSYLTFATHHLLTQVLHREVQITGLDRRPDVIKTCTDIVDELGLSGIEFRQGDIADFDPEGHVHLAISLHACDTATDDALAGAVAWQADVIFAVPCCQHELAAQLPKDRLPLFSNHGILHEKFASLATDAMRASLLAAVGYETRVMEFIDMQHTPKNVLIRGVRRSGSSEHYERKSDQKQLSVFLQQLGQPKLRLQQKLEEFGLLDSKMVESTRPNEGQWSPKV